MLKKHLKTLLALALLFVSGINASDVSSMSNLVDIADQLNEQELKLIESNSKVVCLTNELVQSLNYIDVESECALKNLKDLVRMGLKVAPYDEALEAVNHAIYLCTEHDQNHIALGGLYFYKAMIENGTAVLVMEEGADRRSCKTKKFRRICVSSLAAERIATQCLAAQNAAINCLAVGGVLNVCNINGTTCGAPSPCPLLINSNLTVCGTINGSTFPAFAGPCTGITPTAFIPSISACGDIFFNTRGTYALGATGDPVEFDVAILREVIGFTAPTGLTVTIPNTAGVPNVGGQIGVTATTFPAATIVSGAGITPTAGATPLAAVNLTLTGAVAIASSAAVGNITFTLPVTFPIGLFNTQPSVELTYSINAPATLTTGVGTTPALSVTNVTVSVSNVTTAGMTLNITAVPLAGGTFTIATLQTALQTLLTNLFTNLQLNLIVAGTTAPAV